MKRNERAYRQLKKISTAALLEESGHLGLVLKVVIVLSILFAFFIIWAAFTKIKETAVTYGELVPKGQVQLVQHLEGGIISKVLVNDGDKVKKGQLLIQLKSDANMAELDQLRSREISLVLDSERLRAYIHNRPANIVKWGQSVINSKYNTVKRKDEILKLLEDEKSHLASMNKSRQDQESVLKATIAKRQEDLKQTIQQRGVWKRHLDLLNQEFTMYEKLKKGNLISHKDYLVVLRELNKAKGEYVRLDSEIKKTQEAILEAEGKLKELNSTLLEKAMDELNRVTADLLETRHKIQRIEERLARTNITSPIDGIVKGIRVFAGNVIKPGGLLLEVVPDNEELMAESRINPKDIGFVKIGDPVKVKIIAYDYARYGSVDGKLHAISASTFEDKDGKPYYKATIYLNQQYITTLQGKQKLKSGMTVEASIITGEKTLLQYLLKPIHMSGSKAFHER